MSIKDLIPGGLRPPGSKYSGRPAVCGGVTESIDKEAPRVIQSEDIVWFSVECGFMSVAGPHRYACVYGSAVKCDTGAVAAVSAEVDPYDKPEGEGAVVSGEIFRELQRLVKEYDLARNNGLSHRVAGLPPMLGGRVDVRYASGEYIHIDNNQSPVISPEAGEAIVDVLRKAIAETRVPVPPAEDVLAVTYFEDKGDHAFTRLRLEGTHFFSEHRFGPDEKQYFPFEKEVPARGMEKARAIAARHSLLSMQGLLEDPDGFYLNRAETVTFTMRDGSEHVINNRMRLPGASGNSIFEIRRLLEYGLEKEEGDEPRSFEGSD